MPRSGHWGKLIKIVFRIVYSIALLALSSFSYSNTDDDQEVDANLKDNSETILFRSILSGQGAVEAPKALKVILINSDLELEDAFKYLFSDTSHSSYGTEPPELDFANGSAVLLDMGVRGFLGNEIAASAVLKKFKTHELKFLTLEPGDGCWAAAQMQRPFQLIYFNEKIDVLNTDRVLLFKDCNGS